MDQVVHNVETLVGQRVFGIALGYEDVLDHDELRHDPVLGAVLGRLEAGRRDCTLLAGGRGRAARRLGLRPRAADGLVRGQRCRLCLRLGALAGGGEAARLFTEVRYRTLKTWSRPRRVVGKAEWLLGGANPRFIVTSLSPAVIDRRILYEQFYRARGEIENRIKECQLDLFADRTSTAAMRVNQLRLWFASMAHVLPSVLRRIALAGTRPARATCGSIRIKLLKIGAQVRRSARRIRIAMATACPHADTFAHAHQRLCN